MIDRRTFLHRAGNATLALAAVSPFQTRRSSSYPIENLTKVLEAQVPHWLKAAKVPGLSMVVIQNASIVWRQAFGVKDQVTGARASVDTMFEAASLSKPVFAYLVMKLCEDRTIELDTPLTRYTRDLYLPGDERIHAITARHVLSHTSGFQNWRSDTSPLAIHFTPGSKHQYSGEGYHYLQTVITGLLGQPYERYMRTRIFDPLRMTSSAYVWDDRVGSRMARPHNANGEPIEQNKSTPEGVARYGSAGALLTTASDYARLLIAVIDPPGADRFHLSRASIDEMVRPHVKLEGRVVPSSWALGWEVFHNPTRDFIFHGGNNRGFHCAAVASRAGRSGYVAMTNGDGGPQVLTNLITSDAMQDFLGA